MANIAGLTETNPMETTWSRGQSQAASQAQPFFTYVPDHSIVEKDAADIFQWALLQMYGNQLLAEIDSPDLMPIRTLPERLADLLISLAGNQNGLIENLSHQVLAASVDAERETVTSILRAFARQGFVRLGYGQIEIIDADALEELAEE